MTGKDDPNHPTHNSEQKPGQRSPADQRAYEEKHATDTTDQTDDRAASSQDAKHNLGSDIEHSTKGPRNEAEAVREVAKASADYQLKDPKEQAKDRAKSAEADADQEEPLTAEELRTKLLAARVPVINVIPMAEGNVGVGFMINGVRRGLELRPEEQTVEIVTDRFKELGGELADDAR